MSNVIKVSNLIYYLKNKLDNDVLLKNIIVQGEISNFTNHRSGHLYFTLKDEKSRINCVLFVSNASKINFKIKDGDKVIVKASASIFESTGQLQLYVTNIKLDGLGDLYLQFEKLKKNLYEKGLFDDSHKKQIPTMPFNIGLITGRDTAAREDVIKTISRRWPVCNIKELYVLVQGELASKQIIEAIKKIDTLNLDVVIIARGGGSIEDLWCFNNEELAYTVFNMKTPIISGIGHEVDYTIIDYVADKRASTPTAAAEMATPNINDVQLLINKYKTTLTTDIDNKLYFIKQKLNTYKNSYIFLNPLRLYEKKQLQLDMVYKSLISNKNKVLSYKINLKSYDSKIKDLLKIKLNNLKVNNSLYKTNIINKTNIKFELNKKNFKEKIKLLDAYSPLKILDRGYSLTYIDEKLINSINDVKINSSINIKLKDGKINAEVRSIDNE